MQESDIMENSDDKIKEARFGTVSSTKGAQDTAADVIFYDAEDSGLTFTKKRYKRIYDRAKKRYTKFNEKIIWKLFTINLFHLKDFMPWLFLNEFLLERSIENMMAQRLTKRCLGTKTYI